MHRCVQTSRQDSSKTLESWRSNRQRSRIGAEYLFNRSICQDCAFSEEYIYIYKCIAEAVTCSLCCTVSQLSSRGGVGCGRETRLPRIPMHLHNCAYKFRTLPEGFGWLIVSRVYVARCASSFADSEFYPNELFMRIRAILKRGCNFRLPGISIFVFAFRQRGCARPGPMKCFLLIRPRGVMTRCN